MIYFWLFFLIILFLYFFLVFIVIRGWRKAIIFESDPDLTFLHTTFISVIVATRNEGFHIESLISCLANQNYPASFIEVLFADDHSNDSTAEKLIRLTQDKPGFHVLTLPDNAFGKKAALAFAVRKARGEICVFTDADCHPGPNWLNTITNFYTKQGKPDMIIGLVDLLPDKTFLNACFRLEFASLVITGAGLANRNKAVYCNGANLAIKKSEIAECYELNTATASGDDVFLLHNLKKKKKHIKVLFSKENIVYTNAPSDITGFIKQRIRWASKTTHYKDRDTILLSLLVLSLNMLFVAGFFIGPITGKISWIILFFSLKTLADFLVFYSGTRIFAIKKLFVLVPLIELVYPFYIVYTVFLAIKRPFEWKGREYS